MDRSIIPFELANLNALQLFDDWFLLTAGDFAAHAYNSMTISWGSLGILWDRPIVQVVVRPTRHTFKFIDSQPTFTVSAFPKDCKRALSLLGAKSGRDSDKIKESGLSVVAATQVAAPTFAEAELVLECEKIYYGDFDPKHFLSSDIAHFYDNDFHRCYIGEIVAIQGTSKYRR